MENPLKGSATALEQLRKLFRDTTFVKRPLDAYIVTDCDSHSSEYLAECDKRRDFLTGFTGSAGTAIITEDEACLWTDGRYYIQASKEIDKDFWTLMKEGSPTTPTKEAWLLQNLAEGSIVGVDPSLIQYNAWLPIQNELESAGIHLLPVNVNLVDLIWEGRPQRPSSAVVPLPLKYSGKTAYDKYREVVDLMIKKKVYILVLTALDEIAWLLNLRGSDIMYNPVFFSYVIVTLKGVYLFINEDRITPEVKNHFAEENISVMINPYEKIREHLQDFLEKDIGRVWISHTSNYSLVSLVPEKRRFTQATPVAVLKAVKNETEIQGMMSCHIRDAAALCCYFSWLEANVGKRPITEISGADLLEDYRKKETDYVGLSFPTISSSGPNAAITHYRPKEGSDRKISKEELYLCDSGAQYKDGTTDVTRTMHFGSPTDFEKECFTRVLKGHILLASSIFPEKIKGNCLDALARKHLWDVGLDYMHGTGHGIGMFLNVHEGPMGISWRPYPDDPGLEAGMFLSNEPGYYEEGEFGIRIENIVRIVPAKTRNNVPGRKFLTFENVTLVPIQRKMIVPTMLTEGELAYLNAYHIQCREKVSPALRKAGEKEAYLWLLRETQPITID